MSDPNTRAQTVNVEQIMAQIRARIRDRRGADTSEAQIRELAAARLAGLAGPPEKGAELVEALRRGVPPPSGPEPAAGSLLGLFLRPGPVIRALEARAEADRRHEQFDTALFAIVEHLVLEITRLEVEVRKLEMRLESQAARLDFAERRARSFEGMARSRADSAPEPERLSPRAARDQVQPSQGQPAQGPQASQPPAGREIDPTGSEARRKRRRRRGRRGGTNRTPGERAPAGAGQDAADQAHGDQAGPESGHAEPARGGGEAQAPESRGDDRSAPPDNDDDEQ